ncbi:hypothetical protein EYF80_027048 [Liparis tanakae]|uniref:Uncharacterized protein n=1 Tax=Liparis tanakae TaxID=230148 RepID=A0A4Z2HAC2_9TELE|nr:hypothetical protein EYF80_027048 [Liparis tanakae]
MCSPVQRDKATAWSFIQTANFEEELYLHDNSVANRYQKLTPHKQVVICYTVTQYQDYDLLKVLLMLFVDQLLDQGYCKQLHAMCGRLQPRSKADRLLYCTWSSSFVSVKRLEEFLVDKWQSQALSNYGMKITSVFVRCCDVDESRQDDDTECGSKTSHVECQVSGALYIGKGCKDWKERWEEFTRLGAESRYTCTVYGALGRECWTSCPLGSNGRWSGLHTCLLDLSATQLQRGAAAHLTPCPRSVSASQVCTPLGSYDVEPAGGTH